MVGKRSIENRLDGLETESGDSRSALVIYHPDVDEYRRAGEAVDVEECNPDIILRLPADVSVSNDGRSDA